jgi:TIR domain
MQPPNLTEKQADLLRWLVDEVRAGNLNEDDIEIQWTNVGTQIVGHGRVPEIKPATLDALRNEACLICTRSNANEYRFALTRRAYEIINSTIAIPSNHLPSSPMPSVSMESPSFNSPAQPIRVFISYSHHDEPLKDELYVHLANLTRQGKINPWQDRAIEAGAEWNAEIKAQLEAAGVILLLITPRFIYSEYCFDIEMQRAIARHDEGTARVIPIIMKPCDWQGTAFSKLQVLPRDAKPVTSWSDRDEALLDVVKGIRRAVESLAKK